MDKQHFIDVVRLFFILYSNEKDKGSIFAVPSTDSFFVVVWPFRFSIPKKNAFAIF